nr:hypothetical protein [Chlamydiota bacterium]
MEEPIIIYAPGFVSTSVCALKITEVSDIEAKVNKEYPTGIDSKWEIAEENHFADGEPMPYQCEDH